MGPRIGPRAPSTMFETCMRRTSGIRSYTHPSLDSWSCFWRDEYISTIGILDLFWTRPDR
jgi:hypothetical protein